MAAGLRLLAVFPHPDDETLGLGSTLARYSAQDVETYLVCATRGERGWFDSEGPNPGLEGVARIREVELRCAAENLGIHEVSFLDYVDGAYGHPDHIALSQFTTGALVCAADRNFVDANVQPPHRVLKFYYMVDSVEIVETIKEALGGIHMEVDGATRHHVSWEDWQITTRLDNSHYVDKVHEAMLCHKSQIPGYHPLDEWSIVKLSKIFGTGYFYRAFSLVNGGRRVESDLFEGLR